MYLVRLYAFCLQLFSSASRFGQVDGGLKGFALDPWSGCGVRSLTANDNHFVSPRTISPDPYLQRETNVCFSQKRPLIQEFWRLLTGCFRPLADVHAVSNTSNFIVPPDIATERKPPLILKPALLKRFDWQIKFMSTRSVSQPTNPIHLVIGVICHRLQLPFFAKRA